MCLTTKLVGKQYRSGLIVFEVCEVIRVTKFFSKLGVKILNNGAFFEHKVFMGSDEFETGILNESIIEV